MMGKTRLMTLFPYAWQYLGLLIVSLACSSFCHVYKGKERNAGSVADFELQYQNRYRIYSVPNKKVNTMLLFEDDTSSIETSTQIMQTYLMESTRCFWIEMIQFRGFRIHKGFREQQIQFDVIFNNERTLRRNKDFRSSRKSARTDIRAKIVYNTVKHANGVIENLNSFCNKGSRLLNRKCIRKMSTFRNISFRNTRLTQIQPDVNNKLQSRNAKHYIHDLPDLEIGVNKRIRHKSKMVSPIYTFSRLFRNFKMLNYVRESRELMHSTIQKLSGSNLRSSQHKSDKLSSSEKVTDLNDHLTQDVRNFEAIIIRGVRIQRHYTPLIRNSIFRTRLEARLFLRTSDNYKYTISMDFKSLHQQVNSKLQFMGYKFKQRNDIALQLDLEVFQETPNFAKIYQTQINNLRVTLYNSKNNEYWRTEKQGIRIVNLRKMVDRPAIEKKIMAKQRFKSNIPISSYSKSLTRKISQSSFRLKECLENNWEKECTNTDKNRLRKNVLFTILIQKAIVRREIKLKNYRLKFQLIDRNVKSIDFEIRNSIQETKQHNNFSSSSKMDRSVQKSKDSRTNEFISSYKLFSKYANSTIYRRDASNEALLHAILIGLCALHGSFIYGGRNIFFQKC